MKKWLSKKSNIFFIGILIFAIFQQWPVIRNNFQQENKSLGPRNVKVLGDQLDRSITFPPADKRIIAIFWASWCAPCKLEMSRLQKSVESGAISDQSIFAINPFESNQEAMRFIKENNYPFTFLQASTISSELDIRATPTTLFFDNGIITKMSSGLSIIGIWKAENFLKN